MTIRYILQSIAMYYLYCLAYCVWIESLDGAEPVTTLTVTTSTTRLASLPRSNHMASDTVD
jgi:hypothetical protein